MQKYINEKMREKLIELNESIIEINSFEKEYEMIENLEIKINKIDDLFFLQKKDSGTINYTKRHLEDKVDLENSYNYFYVEDFFGLREDYTEMILLDLSLKLFEKIKDKLIEIKEKNEIFLIMSFGYPYCKISFYQLREGDLELFDYENVEEYQDEILALII